jgi:hypothetical protein
MRANELKKRLDGLGISRRAAAAGLGLGERGLYRQLSGERAVSRQTEMLLEVLEERLEAILHGGVQLDDIDIDAMLTDRKHWNWNYWPTDRKNR